MENIVKIVTSRLAVIKNILNKMIENEFIIETHALYNAYDALYLKFSFAILPCYHKIYESDQSKSDVVKELSKLIFVENYVELADVIFKNIGTFLKSKNIHLRYDSSSSTRYRGNYKLSSEFQWLFDSYPSDKHYLPIEKVNYEQCIVCGAHMVVDPIKSELKCPISNCGTVKELVGTVFDDSQFYSQEGQKAKSGTFNPNRHFQLWWTHLLAREPEESIGNKSDPENLYGEKYLNRMMSIIKRDNKVLRLITVDDVRSMLSECGLTDLNKNVSLIMKKLTGIGPPNIPDSIAVRAENLFTKAVEIDETIRRSNRSNRNYYPFYIHRILDSILPENDSENRRMLYYIYIQSQDTVESDDLDWERICSQLTEIKYVPMDRTIGQKYAPI